jgi:hypothetical protein
MSEPGTAESGESKYYFVDEAGDPILFGSRGSVRIGSEGCSRFFTVGVADIPEAAKLAAALNDLRSRLLADPYFKDVPSMQPGAQKTALLFHAKDDLPEVRREVFSILLQHQIRFSAIVRDKFSVLANVRRRNDRDQQYRYNPNELYDAIVRRLFKERLHKHGSYDVYFARRGSSDRTQALETALERAQTRFAKEHGKISQATIRVVPSSPVREPALQAVDYFLWALQRTFEKEEDRFLQLLWPKCSLIIDADDAQHEKGYGTYYTSKKPLTAAALKTAKRYRSESPR